MPRRLPTDSGGRSPGRAAAFAILEKVEIQGGNSGALLAEIDLEDERERHLATTLVYGVLRRRRALDRLIERVSDRPLADIDPRTLLAIRLALFQILFLTRVPRPAAVDETVRLARARRGRGGAAFANAVLRAVCRRLDEGLDPETLLPDASRDPAHYLAEKYSFPRFLVDRFLGRYGSEECEALLETMNRPAPIAIRPAGSAGGAAALARRLRDEGIETTPSPVLPEALRVTGGAPQRSRSFRAGLFYIQDEAAQIVSMLLLPVDPDGGFLDLCAAPGGKLLAATEGLPSGTRIVAADISPERLRRLRENARRMRSTGILAVAMDAARPALRARFARVLLDAPCSGTGVIRRHPEIRWRRMAADIEASAAAQGRALEAAADLVRPGGRLVYAVCSLEPEEGPDRIAALLAARRDLRVVDVRSVLPSSLHRLATEAGFLRTLPHRDDIDGFFAAALERT